MADGSYHTAEQASYVRLTKESQAFGEHMARNRRAELKRLQKKYSGEEWRDIHGERYRVSSWGRVTNLQGRTMRIDKNKTVRFGSKRYSVAMLVAKAFLPEPPQGDVKLIHVNGDPSDLCADNLVYQKVKRKSSDL